MQAVFLILRTQAGQVVEIRSWEGKFREGGNIPGVMAWPTVLTAELVVKVAWRGQNSLWLRAPKCCVREESTFFLSASG